MVISHSVPQAQEPQDTQRDSPRVPGQGAELPQCHEVLQVIAV